MKHLFTGLALLFAAYFTIAQGVTGFAEFAVVNSSASAPAQITNARIECRNILLLGFKAPQSSNTSTVYVSTTTKSGNGAQTIPVYPGSWVQIKPSEGDKYVMISNVWFDVTTANDGLLVIYE